MKLEGKTALVTGASRGIGRAIALELAKTGVKRLLLVARDARKLAQVAADIELMGVDVVILPLDLTQSVAVNQAIAQAWQKHGPIQLLVNCAGVASQTPFLSAKLSQIQDELSLNLMGTYTITRLLARRMAVHKEGTIVNVSSLMGKIAAPTMATYSATKFALLGFSQALRGELAPYNIRVVALLPSLTDTDMVKGLDWFRFMKPVSPQTVAQGLVKGLEQNTSEILIGWQSHLAAWCQRLVPWLMEKISLMAAPLSPKERSLTLTQFEATSRI
ncbi:SDR family NAD(P)-dependent oxidoreductase [Aphanothece sacrum]|uniref:Short-chain dehydrogenase/reductase SDR n=1 Tax=Aphanothece sacrum FPU1 TaxID=1920663 RepID=A0A401IJE7_APHSA|nr:SDR family NAD(P)-dependent oxidoreductase [Aphanothece sacrum]GBF81435.1 short-chain dehydrogenase/reductase SDR [Aphanothece sacrum FPU1]GBF85566.1 short-chain dehydrogenase/reductase SDR [Aphanothece sacrum FPU3]